jgi:hypothetical protein
MSEVVPFLPASRAPNFPAQAREARWASGKWAVEECDHDEEV